MKVRIPLLSAALLSLALCAPARAETTTYKFCSDNSDNTTYTANTNAAIVAGWTISQATFTTAQASSPYSNPAKFTKDTVVISPTVSLGSYVSRITLGAYVSSTARMAEITPQYENGTWGSTVSKALTEKTRDEVSFDFSTKDKVTAFKIYFTVSGSSTAYLYYTSITTLVPLSLPANLVLSGAAGANDFAVTWGSVADAQGYSVKLLDANAGVVSSNDVAAATTSASFTGLTSSAAYTVVVVALGDHVTTDNSAAATLAVTTAASAVAAPTLNVAVTSWTAGIAGTSAVSATLEGDVACTVASVSMSDGSTATVANGVLSWTPPAANASLSVTATFHVTHGSDAWDLTQILSVAATPAPSAPVIDFDNVSRRSFDASWSASAGGPVASYKLRAWTGRETPDDTTGGASENFAGYRADGTVPDGWIFKNSLAHYNYEEAPVDFKGGSSSVTYWIGSPDFGGKISSFSFQLRKVSAVTGTFSVYGSTGSTNEADWVEIKTLTDGAVATDTYSINAFENGDSLVSAGFSRLFFKTVKTAGNFAFGTFSVSGTDWPAADFLEGWGGAKVSVGAATSQTFSNPVAGTTNWVEVTAVGPSGRETLTRAYVEIPRAPSVVISVK